MIRIHNHHRDAIDRKQVMNDTSGRWHWGIQHHNVQSKAAPHILGGSQYSIMMRPPNCEGLLLPVLPDPVPTAPLPDDLLIPDLAVPDALPLTATV